MRDIEILSSRLRHPKWPWVLSALTTVFGTLLPEVIRAIALCLAVLMATYALSGTKWAGRKKVLATSGFLLFSVIALCLFFGARWLDTRNPIRISPSSVSARILAKSPTSGLQGSLDFRVYNRTSDPYYQLWVKILVKSSATNREQVTIDFPSIQQHSPDTEVKYLCLQGFDAQKQWGFLCFMSDLGPGETFTIRLNSMLDVSGLSDQQIGSIEAAVTHYETIPARRQTSQPNQVEGAGIEMTAREKFQIQSLITFCPSATRPPSSLFKCTPQSKKK